MKFTKNQNISEAVHLKHIKFDDDKWWKISGSYQFTSRQCNQFASEWSAFLPVCFTSPDRQIIIRSVRTELEAVSGRQILLTRDAHGSWSRMQNSEHRQLIKHCGPATPNLLLLSRIRQIERVDRGSVLVSRFSSTTTFPARFVRHGVMLEVFNYLGYVSVREKGKFGDLMGIWGVFVRSWEMLEVIALSRKN